MQIESFVTPTAGILHLSSAVSGYWKFILSLKNNTVDAANARVNCNKR